MDGKSVGAVSRLDATVFVPQSLSAQHVGSDPGPSALQLLSCPTLFHAGSISSCDAFLNVFQSRGLRPEVICPCACSAEALTVAIRR